MSELDVIGTICGTDKSSAITWSWDYLRHYEQLFYKFKSEPINIIEIGVLGGSSIETWKRYFDRATIIGIDIDPACLRFAGDRVIIRIGSQENPEFLQSVTRDHQPSIVIDDGSHLAHHMIASFEALFPALAPGGLYVFEDLSFHFADGVGQWLGASAHQGDSEKSIYDYLSPFIRARMANLSTPQGAWGFTKYAMENIDSVTAFGGVLVVRKRAPRPCEADIAAFERILAKGEDGPPAALHYAAYLVRHDVHHERAFGLLRAHAERDSQDIFALDMLHTMGRPA